MRRLCNAKKKIPASIIATIVLLSSLLVPPASAASSWSKPRPSNDTDYFETIGNAYTNGIASVGMGVQIWDYNERAAGYLDELNLRVSVSANTRVGIGYNINPCSYAWFSVSNSTNITLDNSGVWLDLPFEVALFHGVYYNRVWVCDNGFLSFDSNSTSNTPQAIPNTDKPNSLIAPFWRDLDPDPSKGGSITYGTIGSPGDDSFVISWNGVPNKVNGTAKQSFQIIIFRIGSFSQPYSQHNRIYFQYKSITKDCPTVVGVEDIVGDRGSSYNYNQLASNSGLEVRYPVSGYRIERLRIRLLKSDTAATINVQRPQIGGYNVILKQPPSDTYGDFFVDAVGFGAEHLLGRYVGIPGAGVVFGVWLIVFENAIRLASALSEPIFGVKDAGTSENEANVTSEASSEAPVPGCCKPFDATLSALITWYFNDANDRGHSLKIIAELEYLELLDDYVANYYTISTSVSLNMYIGGDVGPSTSTYAIWWPHQRKTLYAAGRHWVFYSDGTSMVYKTGTDNLTWSAPTAIGQGSSGNVFSVWFDGQYVHYAREQVGYPTSTLKYRKGLPQSNGNMVWSAAEQTVATGDFAYSDPFVSVDSYGYPWIAYIWSRDSSTYYPCVIKSASKNGLWTTASGFPYQLSTTSTGTWRSATIPLTSGKMLSIYARAGAAIRSRRWTGSAWGTESATTSSIQGGWGFSAADQGNDVHLVFLKYSTYDIIYTKYSYASNSWGTEVSIQSATTSLSAPVLSINKANNDLYCFWAGSPTANHIYYKKRSAGTWDALSTDWIDESAEVLTGNDRLTCFYEVYGGKIGLLYMTKTFNPSIPYDVEYAVL